MNYAPPFEITQRHLDLVSEIAEKIGSLGDYTGLDKVLHLRRDSRIESIHSSLKIEANSLSFNEVRDVINNRSVIGDGDEVREVKNAYTAYAEIENVDPYSMDDLLKIHGTMTEGLISESGKFRYGNEGVFSGNKCIFVAPPGKLVPELMENLFDWLVRSKGKINPLILSSIFHYELVFIHPFADGNGRMARFWQSAMLVQWKKVFEFIPIESEIESFQQDYYHAIEVSHSSGNSSKFVEFMLEQINSVIEKVSLRIREQSADHNEYVLRLSDSMAYGVPYSAAELMSALGLKSRDSFRKSYLHPALEMGIVQMTLPDKPTSRNQRYIKV